jgi:copper resistance protein C
MGHRLLAAALCATAVLGLAPPAMALPGLVSATPAQGSTTAPVSEISITFSEPLVAAQSGVEVVMTGMPGMDHHPPMPMTGVKTSLAGDGVTLLARLGRPLPAGTYALRWHAAGGDARRASGTLTFTVK